jgi:hypothetical protein
MSDAAGMLHVEHFSTKVMLLKLTLKVIHRLSTGPVGKISGGPGAAGG